MEVFEGWGNNRGEKFTLYTAEFVVQYLTSSLCGVMVSTCLQAGGLGFESQWRQNFYESVDAWTVEYM